MDAGEAFAMHLIHVRSTPDRGSRPILELEYFVADPPPYAILSHRWGAAQDEITFQDLQGSGMSARRKKGYAKLESFCLVAIEYGLSYAWSDTCCIDKSSSAELSEAINSMYTWYEQARVCFAYLEDVPPRSIIYQPGSAFRTSVWFTRGWTLQELIAPSNLIFVSSDWEAPTLGSKATLADLVHEITGIRKDLLLDRSRLSLASVAQKMSWAAGRSTTRLEDEAYSLLGLFGVNLATIYGEGRRAFRRLQEEILRNTPDHSIFAWDGGQGELFEMLASSPHQFAESAGYEPMEYSDFFEKFRVEDDPSLVLPYAMTSLGLQIQLPVVEMPHFFDGITMAFLACSYGPDKESCVIFLKARKGRPKGHYNRVSFNGRTVIHRRAPQQYRRHASPLLLWISGHDGRVHDTVSPGLSKSPGMVYETSLSAACHIYEKYNPEVEVEHQRLHQPNHLRRNIIGEAKYTIEAFTLRPVQVGVGDCVLIRARAGATAELATVMIGVHTLQHWVRTWLPDEDVWNVDGTPKDDCYDPATVEDVDLFNYPVMWYAGIQRRPAIWFASDVARTRGQPRFAVWTERFDIRSLQEEGAGNLLSNGKADNAPWTRTTIRIDRVARVDGFKVYIHYDVRIAQTPAYL